MDLLTPLGLLGLIGIPILIIIYIIKPKYHKKPISSTFVWKLSLKYRKKKIPLQWLQKSLLLFIQILIVGLTALLLAKPSILIASKDGEKVVILDVSASMNSIQDGKTRLDRAIESLNNLANAANEENKLTVIVADKDPEYLVRREVSQSYIKYSLTTIEPTYEECNFDDALLLANSIIDENPATQVIFYTDCQYENSGYVEVVDFSNNEWNVGILEFNPEFVNGYYGFKTLLGNYNQDASIKLILELDNSTIKYEKQIELKKDQELEVDWFDFNILTYHDAKLTIVDLNGDELNDSLKEDNEYYYCNIDNIKYDVQLVGYQNTFMSAALKSLGNVNLFVPKTEQEMVLSGKELYIFDGYLPEYLPTDGAVWIINPPSSIKELELVVGDVIDATEDNYWVLQATNNQSEVANEIMNYVSPSMIEATRYTKITNYSNYEVLMNCDNNPVLLAGYMNHSKVIVLALDIHYTTLPLSLNMAILVNNVFSYCVNNTIDNSVYNVGDEVVLYSKPLTKQLYVNDEIYMDELNYEDKVNISVNEPGIYEVEQILSNDTTKTDYFFVRVSRNESNYNFTKEVLAVDQYVNIETGVVGNPGSGSFDYQEISMYFAAALLLLLIIEWGVQYREQY